MVIVLTTMLLLYWNIFFLLGALKHHLRDIVTNKLHVVRVWSEQISCNMNWMLFVIICWYTALTPALRQTCIFSYIYISSHGPLCFALMGILGIYLGCNQFPFPTSISDSVLLSLFSFLFFIFFFFFRCRGKYFWDGRR